MNASTEQARDQTRGSPDTPWGLLLLLMATTAIGPTSLNILVPAVPGLSREFGAALTTMQLTVSLFLIGLAFAQLVMGPLSDRYGRRPVMLAGISLNVVASIMAIVTPTAESIIAARVLQAIGASAGVVVARAIIRDLFDRERSASVLGLVATVMVAAPTLGPLIGGLLETFFFWQAIFLFTAITSLAVVIWAAFTLPETHARNATDSPQEGFWRDLKRLGTSRFFVGYVLIASFGSATFFVFLGGGPHIVVNLMGRTSAEYGVWFATSSFGYMAGNFVTSRLAMRTGIHTLIGWGIGCEAIGVVLSILLAWSMPDGGPITVFGPQVVIAFGNGLLLPGAISGAVSVRPQAAGTAAGIIGCSQMALGAVLVQYSAALLGEASSALPMSLLMGAVVVLLALSLLLIARR